MGSRSLETTVGEVLLSNAWAKTTVVCNIIKDTTITLCYVAIKKLIYLPPWACVKYAAQRMHIPQFEYTAIRM